MGRWIFVYVLFVLMTKSKWYFVLPVLALLLIDQSIKKQVTFQKSSAKGSAGETKDKDKDKDAKLENVQLIATQIINVLVITLILVGTLDYMRLQRIEYKDSFSLYKFFFTTKSCKKVAFEYRV